jgi:hypothetical protein
MPNEPNYESLRPFFGYLPVDVAKQTFKKMTQYVGIPMSTYLKKRFKLPFLALNVHHWNEPVASTDMVYSGTPTICGGETQAQLFIGTESIVMDVFGTKTDKPFINTLEDNNISVKATPCTDQTD